MNKVIAIKVKNLNNGYDEIPITALAQNVYWDNNLDLNLKQHIVGNIKTGSNDAIIPLQTQINEKADINSPVFTGIPKSVTPTSDDNSTNIATTAFVKNQIQNHLKESNLKTNTLSELTSSNPTDIIDQQYPVVFDSEGNLSVNVPWTDTDTVFSSKIENLWTGSCSELGSTAEKVIYLDNPSSFPSHQQLTGDEVLAIYFKEKNTISNPKLIINDEEYSIGVLNQLGNIEIISNVAPFYNFGSGLKIFVYKSNYNGNDDNCWLLSTADYLAISYLKDNKANINSPTFTGIPKINVNGTPQEIATQSYVDANIENHLTTNDLSTTTPTNLNSITTTENERQYSVVYDATGKLSVNVPWVAPQETINNIQKLWTGKCETSSDTSQKTIVLNNESNNYGNLITIVDGNPPTINENSSILIYFKYGNDVNTPIPTIIIRGLETLEKNILYQSGPNSYSTLERDPYYKWGPGLKIFTYVKYIENDVNKDGWVIDSFDGLITKNLNERLLEAERILENKANLNSPVFEGIPTAQLPSGNIANQIATVGYVQLENSKILNADVNYAFQLKKPNSNGNIFSVDWEGKANGVDLNCFNTQGIRKSRPESTIIGKYNTTIKTATGLVCSVETICSEDQIVGGPIVSYDSGNYAFVIGNGIDDNNRSNALTVDWDGRVEALNFISNGGVVAIKKPAITIGINPTSAYHSSAVTLQDSTGYTLGALMHSYVTDGRAGLTLESRRIVNDQNLYNCLRLFIDGNGTKSVVLSDPVAWRSALGLSNIGDLVRLKQWSKNVSIGANNYVSPVEIVVPTDDPPPEGFTFVGIVGWRIDGSGMAAGTAVNTTLCTVTNYWGTPTEGFKLSVRNLASSTAKVTVNVRVLFKRTTF